MDNSLQHCNVTVKNTFIEFKVTQDVLGVGEDGGVISPSMLKRQGSEPVLSSAVSREMSTPVKDNDTIALDYVAQASKFSQSLSVEQEPDIADHDLSREDTDELWPSYEDNDSECPAQTYDYYYVSGDVLVPWAPGMWGLAAPSQSVEAEAKAGYDDDLQASVGLAMHAVNAADADCHPYVHVLASESSQVNKLRRRKRKSVIDIAFAAAAKAEALATAKPKERHFNDILQRQISSSSNDSAASRTRENTCHVCKGVWKEHFKFCGYCGVSLSTVKK
mmetsp:Transcript_56090/g.88907  ORF Transcript_56090/g.88907 Transcript_56090/m.88907 type:complete len:277 (+) Transcript_56090:116-946(+)